MEAKFTKGPWLVVEDDYSVFNGYLDENHIQGYNIRAESGRVVVGSEGISVEDEDVANACLIATAPELLETVRALHFLCNALMGELGIEPETTEFNFRADGRSIAALTAGDFLRGADKVIAKALGA